MPIYEFEGKRPRIGENSFIHPEAVVIGDVIIGQGCFIGANCTLRGDYGGIIVGDGSNIQDNSVVHMDLDTVAEIGRNVLIGHTCIIHGPCNIEDNCTVGMMSAVSMGCTMESGSFLAMGSILTPGKSVPAGMVAMGRPAQVVRELSESMKYLNTRGIQVYQELAGRCLEGLKRID